MKKQSYTSKEHRNIWQLQEAKAKFSQLVAEAITHGYQTITKKGESVAVLLSKKDFDKIVSPKTSLLEFFKAAPCQDVELDIKRPRDVPREIDL